MDGELLSLKWNNHKTTFFHVISGLRNKESYTDVTLACEGKFYPVHKLVLSTCSEYFSDIFERTPCKNPVVVLKDIQCRDIEFLLDYMYIGEVNVRQNELSSLIKAAECLKIKGLAVPDEEPKKGVSSVNSVSTAGVIQVRQRPEQTSPPAKRRKAEERRVPPTVTEPSPGRPPPADPAPTSPERPPPRPAAAPEAVREDDRQSVDEVQIKVEQEIIDATLHDDYAAPMSNSYDDTGDDGDGPRGSEGNTNDFPEFLQSTIEKEEPVAMGEFNPGDFPGPSGLQNSGMASWDNENSSASFAEGLSGAVAAAVAAASQPQRQQQQQQLLDEAGRMVVMCEEAFGVGDVGGEEVGGGGGPLRCPVCGRESSRRDHLKRHMRIHTGEKPHKCPFCPFRSLLKWNVKSHMQRRHTTVWGSSGEESVDTTSWITSGKDVLT